MNRSDPGGVSRVHQNELLVTVGKQVWSGGVRDSERLEATLRVKRSVCPRWTQEQWELVRVILGLMCIVSQLSS